VPGRQVRVAKGTTAIIAAFFIVVYFVSCVSKSEARKEAALLAPGKVRDALLEKVRQYEALIPEDLRHQLRFALVRDSASFLEN
jgi:hypothetical protein